MAETRLHKLFHNRYGEIKYGPGYHLVERHNLNAEAVYMVVGRRGLEPNFTCELGPLIPINFEKRGANDYGLYFSATIDGEKRYFEVSVAEFLGENAPDLGQTFRIFFKNEV